MCKGRKAPLATLWNCTIVYLIIATNATHTQARTIITVLDFLLAQNTPPVALWACMNCPLKSGQTKVASVV